MANHLWLVKPSNGLNDKHRCTNLHWVKKSYLLLLAISLSFSFLFSACGGDDGFKTVKTQPTQSTVPSSTPNKDQPCSLISKDKAAKMLGIEAEKIDPPDVNESSDILRCRYSTLSDDNTKFISINAYIFKTQEAFDRTKKANKGTSIGTDVKSGFSYVRVNDKESERFVGVNKDNTFIGLSASVSLTSAEGELNVNDIKLPSLNDLATQVGVIISKL